MRIDVGRYSIDPRDVAGVTRGAGARGLELTVHIFPPKKVRDQIQSNRQIRALRVPPNIRPSAPKVRPRPDRSLTDNPQGLFGGGKRSGDLRRPVTLSFNSEAELFTARRDILRRCMPHGNLWGWGETGRRDSVSGAVAADAAPEPSKAGRLLVLVNPAAGKGRGVAAYERDVAPVLAALSGCGVVVEMRVTALRGEAMKIANALDLDAYRAVVCVGGDGTLAEVFNGLMTRPDAARAQSFPVGVVPAGSGNAVAKSLTHRVAQPCEILPKSGVLNEGQVGVGRDDANLGHRESAAEKPIEARGFAAHFVKWGSVTDEMPYPVIEHRSLNLPSSHRVPQVASLRQLSPTRHIP